MGYKAMSYMDSGYFYAPYIPLTRTPIVLDPDSFNPRKGILTRYGKKLNEEAEMLYQTITVNEILNEDPHVPSKVERYLKCLKEVMED
jgi:hypothetical protein